jgi:hypothetical protein
MLSARGTQCGLNFKFLRAATYADHHRSLSNSWKSLSRRPESPAKHAIMLSNSGRDLSQPQSCTSSCTVCTVRLCAWYILRKCSHWSGFISKKHRMEKPLSILSRGTLARRIKAIMCKRTWDSRTKLNTIKPNHTESHHTEPKPQQMAFRDTCRHNHGPTTKLTHLEMIVNSMWGPSYHTLDYRKIIVWTGCLHFISYILQRSPCTCMGTELVAKLSTRQHWQQNWQQTWNRRTCGNIKFIPG